MKEMTEKEFLKSYDPNKYEKPSVTADILIFTMNKEHNLELLLIKRGGHPNKGKWALPGGFVGIDESIEEAAKRELLDETGLEHVYLEQLYTFGEVNRDPRMRVISVAYMALTPMEKLVIRAGDDAAEAKLFKVTFDNWETAFCSADGIRLSALNLAFDHGAIIQAGLKRLSGKLDYTDIAFELLEDKQCFTTYEIQKVFEGIKGKPLDGGNFRRYFKTRYLDTKIVTELGETSRKYSRREAKCYCYQG